MTGNEMYAAFEIRKNFPDMSEGEAANLAARIQVVCRNTQVDVLTATQDICQWIRETGQRWQDFPGMGQ